MEKLISVMIILITIIYGCKPPEYHEYIIEIYYLDKIEPDTITVIVEDWKTNFHIYTRKHRVPILQTSFETYATNVRRFNIISSKIIERGILKDEIKME